MRTSVLLAIVLVLAGSALGQHVAPLGTLLDRYYTRMSDQDEATIWIYFTDKGPFAEQKLAAAPTAYLSQRAIQRRANALKSSNVTDMQDVPVEPSYINQVKGMVQHLRHEMKWFNAVSAVATKQQIEAIRRLPFVSQVDAVARYKSRELVNEEVSTEAPQTPPPTPDGPTVVSYGNSLTQNQQINTVAVHNLGINGQNVLVGIFDAGFSYPTHPALVTRPVVARYDFITNRDSLTWYSHGQNTFSVVGGFLDGTLIGPAYGASFVLARTEDANTETPIEEDAWARAIIWADSIGIDVSSTSLGYDVFDSPWPGYSWQDMNGRTSIITRAADRAFQMGIVVVNSAGNSGLVSLPQNSLGAPADGFNVIAAGAVDATGSRVSFSSVGPSADGRIKPDIMAMGSGVYAASGATGYGSVSGTSFSCPLSAGVAALVVSANPGITPPQVREAMQRTASRATTPDRLMGYGILDALKAINYPWLDHTPPPNTEDTSARTLQITLRSRVPIIPESTVVMYGVEGVFSGSAPLVYTGFPNQYTAQIPNLGNNIVVSYYIKAGNASVTRRLPLNAPASYFSYQVGQDYIPPTIIHTPLGNQSISSWPPKISAKVSDASGLSVVRVEYSKNGTVQTPFNLVLSNGEYSDTLHLSRAQVAPGDSIAYRIVAIDNAHTPNTATYPASGTLSFIVKNYDNVSLDFENNSGSLTATNDWQWGVPSIPSPAAHGGVKCWGTILNGNYTAGPRLSSLTTPTYTVFSNRASFSFWHWYEMQGRFDGGNVKVSINGGAFQTIQPTDSFPQASIYNGFGNPLGGQPGYSSTTGTTWSKVNFDLTGIATEGNTIAVRFDFGADNSIQYRGWYVDDFSSEGFGTLIPAGVGTHEGAPMSFALEQNFPNPFNPSTGIRYQLPSQSHVTLKVFDVLGREVATLVNEIMPAGTYEAIWDASGNASGTYIYRLEAGSFIQNRKMLLLK